MTIADHIHLLEGAIADAGSRLEKRAIRIQRFFVTNEDEAAEAVRRAKLEPELVLRLGQQLLEDCQMPGWEPTCWWDAAFNKLAREEQLRRIREHLAGRGVDSIISFVRDAPLDDERKRALGERIDRCVEDLDRVLAELAEVPLGVPVELDELASA